MWGTNSETPFLCATMIYHSPIMISAQGCMANTEPVWCIVDLKKHFGEFLDLIYIGTFMSFRIMDGSPKGTIRFSSILILLSVHKTDDVVPSPTLHMQSKFLGTQKLLGNCGGNFHAIWLLAKQLVA